MSSDDRAFYLWLLAIACLTVVWLVRIVVKAKGPAPAYPEAETTQVCDHRWEKDGDRVEKTVTDDCGNESDVVAQPCRCTKCGEMTSFEL